MKHRSLVLASGVAATAIVAVLSFAPLSIAQEASKPTDAVSSPPAASAQPVDDATLKKVAEIFPEIRQINKETQSAMQQTQDKQQLDNLLSQARSRQLTMLQQKGLTQQQYEGVLMALNSNPELMQRFESISSPASGT